MQSHFWEVSSHQYYSAQNASINVSLTIRQNTTRTTGIVYYVQRKRTKWLANQHYSPFFCYLFSIFLNNNKNLSCFYPRKSGKQTSQEKPPISSSYLTVPLRYFSNNLPTKYAVVNLQSNRGRVKQKSNSRLRRYGWGHRARVIYLEIGRSTLSKEFLQFTQWNGTKQRGEGGWQQKSQPERIRVIILSAEILKWAYCLSESNLCHTHITWVQKFFINSLRQHCRLQDHWMPTSSCYITTTLLL